VFALNIMPYVTSSIILSLMGVVVPTLMELRKEGEAGQRKINQYTRYGTILISIVQSFFIAQWMESMNGDSSAGDIVVWDNVWAFRLMTVLTLTTGTAFLMWLGEQITERGVGNGISLIIFAGIVAGLPDAIFQTSNLVQTDQIKPVNLLMIVGIGVIVIMTIVFFERAQRRLPIQYAKRRVGNQVYGGQQSHLPLKVNQSGVIPPIFASSLLMFPMTLAQAGVPGMNWINNQLNPDGWLYIVVFASMNIFFCFFYTAVTFQPVDVAENLKKQNSFIPGIRPGKATADYIDRVMTRITVGGALYVAAVCTVPTLLQTYFRVPFYFGGTSLMIVVGVALDTANQVESHMITRHYEGLMGPGGARVKGRKG
jgi:preprotein translocase subunit SecY